ncbi:protein kinase domain-containing protein, partial [Escherichia coli]|uniref:protein kinase domain-containing protein n=1 Tax=Escherichia coli TaxID=562 RepID=UPI0018E268B5
MVYGSSAAFGSGVPAFPQRNPSRCEDPQYLRGCTVSSLCKYSSIQLGDLGVSKILKADCGLYSRVGTPLYLAPEIIRSEKYDHKADIWG